MFFVVALLLKFIIQLRFPRNFSIEPMLHLRTEVVKLLRSIMQDFLKLEVIRADDPLTIEFEDKSKYVPLKEVYIGINATSTLSSCSDNECFESEKSNAVQCKPPSLQDAFTLMPLLRNVADSSLSDL